MDREEKLRNKIAKALGKKPSEINLNTFSGQTIIDKDVLTEEECTELLRGQYVEGVGCVTNEEEQPDGSKIYTKPSIKVYRKSKKPHQTHISKENRFVSEEEIV